ncbi:Opacity protein [Bryocella elongata]|uniref:Opacity protein n=1 Tax=Bryocella elongata TaxID=863522 RepID=A0A1H5XXS0_9BACT|nr:porin family protein [Bryocella elongata]SEG16458.1 Opacity protein [Bryocella elongata]
MQSLPRENGEVDAMHAAGCTVKTRRCRAAITAKRKFQNVDVIELRNLSVETDVKPLRECLRLAAFALSVVPIAARGQASPTAAAPGTLQLGGSAVLVHSNYLPWDTDGNPAPLSDLTRTVRSLGFGVYGNYDFNGHLGIALDFARVAASNDTSTQTSFEGGLRYKLFERGRFTPYARGSFGRGVYGYSNNVASVGYNLYGLAGGVDYRFTHYLNLRAEYEYQGWMNVPLRNPEPQMFKLGVAYRFGSDIQTTHTHK